MTIDLNVLAKEESTYIISSNFKDENDQAVIPKTIHWSLSDIDGIIINSREDVEITNLDSSVDILLSGDDLALPDESNPWRILIIKATYNSTLGVNLPLNEECRFKIVNWQNIT